MKRNQLWLAVSLVCAGTVSSENVLAQQDQMEEILVTARKRVENLQEVPVSVSALNSDAIKVLMDGNQYRTVGSTAMNNQSSRSHSVFTISVEATITNPDTGLTRKRHSKFNLVDLAGSERQTMTGTTGLALTEAQYFG